MLEKFGFSGRLGQNRTGVSTNVEVAVRPAGAGLGYGTVTEAASLEANKKIAAELRGEEYKSEEPPKLSMVEQMAASGGWKKSRKKDKTVKYVTAEEILDTKIGREHV